MYVCGKYCLIRIHIGGHRSAVSLSALNVSPLTQTIALMWGSDPGFSSPPVEGRSSPTNTPVFLPRSLVLPSFAWFYIFFNTGQVLLSALSWCSACTFVSEGVLLMYPWRELYSMSTFSSAILFSHYQLLIARLQYREPMSPCPFPSAAANNFSLPSTPKT